MARWHTLLLSLTASPASETLVLVLVLYYSAGILSGFLILGECVCVCVCVCLCACVCVFEHCEHVHSAGVCGTDGEHCAVTNLC